MPAMVEYGPIVRTVREDAKVPEAKQQAVRIPKRMLSTLGHYWLGVDSRHDFERRARLAHGGLRAGS